MIKNIFSILAVSLLSANVFAGEVTVKYNREGGMICDAYGYNCGSLMSLINYQENDGLYKYIIDAEINQEFIFKVHDLSCLNNNRRYYNSYRGYKFKILNNENANVYIGGPLNNLQFVSDKNNIEINTGTCL